MPKTITQQTEITPEFPFRSDKAPAEVIRAVTSQCPDERCAVSFKIEETTLMGGAPDYYNKQGMLIVDDPNRFNARICCRICRRAWRIRWANA